MAPLRRILPTQLTWRFGLLILFLASFSLVVGTQAAIDTNANTRCLADYAARQAEVSAIRGAATAKRDAVTAQKDAAVAAYVDAIEDVIRRATPNAREELQEAGRAYRKAKNASDEATKQLTRERAANPLPEFPKKCSEVNQ